MPNLRDLLRPLVGERPSAIFSVLLVFHIIASIVCVIAGAVAALSAKRHGQHPRFGKVYYWGLIVVFASATGMSALRWSRDSYLFTLEIISFGAASIGYLARRIRWPGWTSFHIVGMGLSYIVLLTAFYVDNGARLPLWDRLSPIAYWTIPGIVGLPLVVIAVRRHTRFYYDLIAATHATAKTLADSVRRFFRRTLL